MKWILVAWSVVGSVHAQILCNRGGCTRSGGSTGYPMHRMNGTRCEQRCFGSAPVRVGWTCGKCNATAPIAPIQAPVAVRSPTKRPITPIGPSPVAGPSPVPAPRAPPITTTPPVAILPPVSPSLAPHKAAPSMAPIPISPPVAAPSVFVPAPLAKPPAPPAGNLPPGPYIASGYSERITLPQPKQPLNLGAPRDDCPHSIVMYQDLKDWHAPSTWPGGAVPTSGQDVTLPLNTRVVIQKTVSDLLGLITIPVTSSLIIGETTGGIELKIKGMDVKGSLIAGSVTCRIETPITIILYGTRPADAVTNQPAATYKGLSVTGTLSLHGKRYFRTWTRLSKTANPGDRVLLLQDPVNWMPGQAIVLVTTAMKDSREWHQNELHTVQVVDSPSPVSGVGAAVYLNGPIQYKHLANSGYQAEVGLLSRTITIQGSASDSEPTDLDPLTCVVPPGEERYGDKSMPCGFKQITGFGGHVMVHQTGKGFVEGVEFFRMGQTNVLGRYPMHFHLLGNCSECYVRDSSFHHSFYRCISIHGTNQVTVAENVAYDITGYCFYLEDGVEENNTLEFNLAAHIHAIGPKPPNGGGSQSIPVFLQGPNLLLPADVTASGFYITNMHNNLIGNAASGVSSSLGTVSCLVIFSHKNYSWRRDGLDLPFQC
jgi:G8 domain